MQRVFAALLPVTVTVEPHAEGGDATKLPTKEHSQKRIQPVSCAVLTVSDTRTTETDQSGRLIQELFAVAGHIVSSYEILPDEPGIVRDKVRALCEAGTVHAILISGGTGVTTRDTTHEAVTALFEKRLDGFGELFRMISFDEIGPAAMLSRAAAGVCRGTAVFAMPGSPSAVRLALERLILPALPHLAFLLRS